MKFEDWWHEALEGEIALADGDVQKAIAAFSAAEPKRGWFGPATGTVSILASHLPFRDGLARVARVRGDAIGAIHIYRRLLAYGPEHNWVSMFEPRYVLEIARLLEQAGDKQAARQEYERFLDLWKRADSDVPELAEARRAVARLRAEG